MMSKVRLLCGLLFMMSSSYANGQENDETNRFVDQQYGFTISRPGNLWSFNKTEPKPGSSILRISLTKSGGAIEATIIADYLDEEKSSSESLRDAAIKRSKNDDKISNLVTKSFTVAGNPSEGFVLDWRAGNQTYRVQQSYIVNHGIAYTIGIHAPKDRFDEVSKTLVAICDSIQFTPVSRELKRAPTLNRLAARCGSEVNLAKSWEEASQRATDENKAILILIRSQTGFDIADGVSTIALMDKDIIEFLNEHCIVYRHQKGVPAPIESYDKYGIGPSSFGSTVLLTEPDGTVFGDTFLFAPQLFYDFLLSSFSGRVKTEFPDRINEPILVAKWYASRGKLDAAINQLDGNESSEADVLRASIYRRQRKAPQAIEALASAMSKSQDPYQLSSWRADKTMLQLSTGMLDANEALRIFREILRDSPKHDRAAELRYYVGEFQFAISKTAAAKNTWLGIIEKHGEDNRWSWKAAATLTSNAFKLGIKPEFGWTDEEVLSALRDPPFQSLPVEQIDRAQQDAIRFLIENQREDGSWISPPDSLQAKGYKTSPFTIAITSICARSLLPYRDDPEIAGRIDRAFEFLLKFSRENKNATEPLFYMDYSPWADAYLLRFVASHVKAHPSAKKKASKIVRDTIKALAEKQKSGGGWSYYITQTLGQQTAPSNQSISFMTATVTISLLETRDAGFNVPNGLLEPAIECLTRMRNKNQTFTYFLWHDNESGNRNDGLEGSVGRGPLCALALFKAGVGSSKEVTSTLERFMEFRQLYVRERGKSLMHAAPGGQGSHYLMFDYAWAAEAANTLPEEQLQLFREKLLELILQSRSEQGSYLDNPINGWHYGTAMALDAMNLLK